MLVHQTGPESHSLDPGRSLDHALMPFLDVGEAFELLIGGDSERDVQSVVPRNKGEISVSDAIPYQPLLVGLSSQYFIQDSKDSLDLLRITLDCGGQLLGVQIGKPINI